MESGIKPGHKIAATLFFASFIAIYVFLIGLAITFSAPLAGEKIQFATSDLFLAIGAVVSTATFFVTRAIIYVGSGQHSQLKQYTSELISEQRAAQMVKAGQEL